MFYHVIGVRSRRCGCLVTWFCYQLIAKPGNKTATPSGPDPYNVTRQLATVCNTLTHWGRDKMAAILQMIFSDAFCWMKMYEFWLRFHWSLFPRVQPLSEPMMVNFLTPICVNRPQRVNSIDETSFGSARKSQTQIGSFRCEGRKMYVMLTRAHYLVIIAWALSRRLSH